MIANVYMPTDNNEYEAYDEYVCLCTMIHSLFSDSDCVYLVVAGDFNCKLDSKFYDVFCKFLIDQQLICVDLLKLHGVHIFISDDGQRIS